MSNNEIQSIIVGYLKNYNPEYIGLFGSFSRSQEITESDIDILMGNQRLTTR